MRIPFGGICLICVIPIQSLAQETGCFGTDARTAVISCAVALQERETLTASEIARLRRAQAGHLLTLEQYRDALGVLDTLRPYDGATDHYHVRRALAYQGLGQNDDAKDAISKALELNPHNVESLLFRAELGLATDQLDQAVSDAGLAATLAPENPATHDMMAKALAALGATEAAARSEEAAAANLGVTEAVEANALELGFWNDVKDSDSPEEIELFLQAFPNSVFAPLGKLRLQRMTSGSGSTATTQIAGVSLPPTTALDLTSGTLGANVAVSSVELADGRILTGGAFNQDEANKPKGRVALYDHAGGMVWEKILDSEFSLGVVTDVVATRGNTLVAVDVRSNSWAGANSAKLMAYDLSGHEVWQHIIGPVARHTGIVSLTSLADGGVLVVTGTDAEKKSDINTLIVKLDAEGNVIWRKASDIPQEDAAFGATEGDGSLFVVGSVMISDTENGNPWVRKFDQNGTLIWKRTLHTRRQSFASDVVVMDGGDLIVLGTFQRNGDQNSDNTGSDLNWLTRLDPAGTTIWETEISVGPESNAYRLAQLANGEIAVGGTAGLGDVGVDTVGWVLYFDGAGQETARRVFGGHREEMIYDTSPTHDGGVLLSGGFNAEELYDRTAWVKRLPPRASSNARDYTPEGSALLEQCVLLAAHPSDRQNPFEIDGHSWADFDARQAEKPCNFATAVFPQNSHAIYHLGRVEHKLENWGRALDRYNEAMALGHVRAMVGAAVINSSGPERFRDLHRAATSLKKAVTAENDPIAASMLGDAYSKGAGVLPDAAKAVAHYRIAANAGSASAQYQMGRHYDDGSGVPRDASLARQWYETASNNNHIRASYQLAYFHQWGIGGEQDRHKAFDLFNKAADGGDPDATLFIADEYRWGGDVVTASTPLARQWYQLAIDRGAAAAYANLGFLYQYGQGVSIDPGKALELYRQGVKAGAGNSHYYLGKMYQDGVEVDKNLAEAVRLYEVAVSKDESLAMVALAYLHRDGTGMPTDETRAYALFQAAANLFDRTGQREAGWLQFLGRGVTKDVRAAITQIEKADSLEDDLAAVYLGYIFESDTSVHDPKRAAKHYYDALSRGQNWPTARKARDWNRDTARALQELLRDAGYFTSKIDGSMGAGSVAAMKALCRCE